MAIELNLYLGIIWNNADPDYIQTKSLSFLAAIEKSLDLDRIPLHWAIPSFPLLEKSPEKLQDVITIIEQRIKTSGDVIMAMGYGHNMHPPLSTNECKFELAWNIENSWKSGIKDVFDYKPEILLPKLADLYRKESIEHYIQQGFNKIAIPAENFHYFNHNLKQFETLFDFDYFIYDSIFPDLPIEVNRNLKKGIGKGLRDFILFLDLQASDIISSESEQNQNLASFLQKLNHKYRIQFKSLQDENKKTELHDIVFQDKCHERTLYSHTASNRGLLQNLHKKRKDFLDQNKIHDVLIELSPLGNRKLSTHPPKELFPPATRFNDASMPGEARMAGSMFTVIFQGGQITDMEANGKTFLCSRPGRSYIQYKNAIQEAENISTFSVMDETLHGLRDIQLMSHKDWASPMKMITDYFFIDEFPFLLCAVHIDYPEFNKKGNLQSIAPYELTLFEMEAGDELVVTAYSDSFDYRETVRAKQSQYLLAGNYFCFNYRQQNIIIGFPSQIDPTIGSMEFRVKEQDEKYLFQANIFGTYLNSSISDWDKKSEEASFFIGLQSAAELPEFNSKILKELPNPRVWSR
ncbi:MAG: hypothetical protein JXR70_17705 [Spirochaetales bacterium]|nr:hypothetical protein [Spirochaetales bacterium]